MKAKDFIYILGGTTLLLSIPLVAMQFTDDIQWDGNDFITMGALIAGAATLFTLIARKLKTTSQRVIAGVVIFGALGIIWVELAVGIFD